MNVCFIGILDILILSLYTSRASSKGEFEEN